MAIKWDEYDNDGELAELVHLVINGWSWEWPGWTWIADRLNEGFDNERTASSCRYQFNKYEQIKKKEATNLNQKTSQ